MNVRAQSVEWRDIAFTKTRGKGSEPFAGSENSDHIRYGYYLSAAGVLSTIGFLVMRETRDTDLRT